MTETQTQAEETGSGLCAGAADGMVQDVCKLCSLSRSTTRLWFSGETLCSSPKTHTVGAGGRGRGAKVEGEGFQNNVWRRGGEHGARLNEFTMAGETGARKSETGEERERECLLFTRSHCLSK